jgi:hypothetical protein
MWPAIQKPKTLKELQKEIPSSGDVGRRLAMAQVAEDYEAAMIFLRFGHATRAHSDRASLASLAPRCTSLTPAFHYMPGKISSKF